MSDIGGWLALIGVAMLLWFPIGLFIAVTIGWCLRRRSGG